MFIALLLGWQSTELPCSAASLPGLCKVRFLANGHCTMQGTRLLNMTNQLCVFHTPWTHCAGDEVIHMHTGKLSMRNRSGMQDGPGTIFKPGHVGRSGNFISCENW